MTTMTAMTAMTAVTRPRKVACIGTIAATLPYLALKVAWATGSHLGVKGDAMENSTMVGANLATVGMDAAAAALALALVRPWGRRIPAWLLVFPLWVATGFIAPILVGAPLSGVMSALSGGGADNHGKHDAAQDIAGWVFGVVYGGFILQGIGLAIGFFLYARSRWATVFRLTLRDLPVGAGFASQRTTITGVAAFSLIPSGIHLYWAFGGTGLLRPDLGRTWQEWLVLESVFALLPLIGSAAMLVLARRRDPRSARTTLAAAWIGTGAMFAWGFWWMVCASLKVPLSEGKDMRGLGLVGSLGMLAGAVLATVLAQTVSSTLATQESDAPSPGTSLVDQTAS